MLQILNRVKQDQDMYSEPDGNPREALLSSSLVAAQEQRVRRDTSRVPVTETF